MRSFEREAKAISQISHPNICTLHDVGNADGVDDLVLELLEGETLRYGRDRVQRSGSGDVDSQLRRIQRPSSSHYFDQAALYARREFKPAWFTTEEVNAHTERVYQPGDR